MKFIVFAFLLLFPSFAMANLDPAIQGKRAENFVRALGNEAIATLDQTKGDPVKRRAMFKKILSKSFDMKTIARFAMGRYWAIATEAEKKTYTRLFKKMVIDVYSNRFADYKDQKFEIVGHKPAGRKDFVVNSFIKGDSRPVNVDWRVRNGKVIDVMVEGVSMSVTQRSEFGSVIQRGGGKVSSLIDHLQK